jgi:VIT1/CCC1 family predicted Fe2+/Mn2+ transporter
LAHDNQFFVTTGVISTSLLVVILTGIQALVSSTDPSFTDFLLTLILLDFMFLLGALVLSATSWTTKSNWHTVILSIVLTLISILIYNFAVGGAIAIWNGSTAEAARISALNWIINLALTVVVTGGVFYARIRWKK